MKVLKKRYSKRAVALIIVLLFLLLVMLSQIAVLIYVNSQTRLVEKRKVFESAIYGADSGVEWAKYKVAEFVATYDSFGDMQNPDVSIGSIPSVSKSGAEIDVTVTIDSIEYEKTKPDYEDVCEIPLGVSDNPYDYDGECSNYGPPDWVTVNSFGPYECDGIAQIFQVAGSVGRATRGSLYDEIRTINAKVSKNWRAKVWMEEKESVTNPSLPNIICIYKLDLYKKDPFIKIIKWEEEK